jgi:hypothetical protein
MCFGPARFPRHPYSKRNPMHNRFAFARAVLVLTLLGISAPVYADFVILNNLDQPPQTATINPFVGQSFIAGTVNEVLFGARMQLDVANGLPTNIVLEVEARSAEGTVGSTLYTDFTASFDTSTDVVTFSANSHFELKAGEGYWLVLSDKLAGGVAWDFTESNTYQSEFGYGLPSFNTSMISTANNGMGNTVYYQPSDGPQLFQLIAARSVPEPSSLFLLIAPVAIAVITKGFQRNRASKSRRSREGHAAELVCP